MAFVKADDKINDEVEGYSLAIMGMFHELNAPPNLATAAMLKAYIATSAIIGIPYEDLLAATARTITENEQYIRDTYAEYPEHHMVAPDTDKIILD